jgi:hypothetical protein
LYERINEIIEMGEIKGLEQLRIAEKKNKLGISKKR